MPPPPSAPTWSQALGADVPTLTLDAVRCWAMSPDDRILLVAEDTGAVRWFELSTGREIARIDGGASVTALAWPGQDAWIVRSGPGGHATLHVGADRFELVGLDARAHHVTFAASGAAFVARTHLHEADRPDPSAALGCLVDLRTGASPRTISLREIGLPGPPYPRRIATSLADDGHALAVASGRIAVFDLDDGTSKTFATLDLPGLDVQWTRSHLLVRSARDDAGGHRFVLGRVILLDAATGRVAFDTLRRPRDPDLQGEWDLGTTHAVLDPTGGRMIVLGHAMYLPHRTLSATAHGRAYEVAVPGGEVTRILELDTNPWTAVGAAWTTSGRLTVLTCAGGRWALTAWGDQGPERSVRLGSSTGVLHRARVWSSPAGRYLVVAGPVWPSGARRLWITPAG